ncbi:MAG: DoxX family protein [Stellaceae bacterium]
MNLLEPYRPQLLSILRITTALFFLEHPAAKFLHWPFVPYFAHLSPLSWPIGIAGIIETVFGLLLLIGIIPRIAAFILSGEMAIAYFMYHVAHGGILPILNHGEPAVLYCFIFLFIAAAGPGPWSLDALWRKDRATA